MAAADGIYVFARATLDALVAGWPAPGDAEPLPARQYVAFGQVAWDCEQLVVSIERTFTIEADVAQESFVGGSLFYMRGVTLAVSLIRCVPTADLLDDGETIVLPDGADIEVSARIAAVDAQTMTNVIIAAQQAGALAGCSGLAFENWTSDGPEGGFGGGTLRVRMAMF